MAAIQGVLASLSPPSEDKSEVETEQQQIPFVDHKPEAVAEKAWYLASAVPDQLGMPEVDEGGRWSPAPIAAIIDSESSSSAVIQMTSIDVMIIDDSGYQERPLIILSGDLEATAHGFGSKVQPMQVGSLIVANSAFFLPSSPQDAGSGCRWPGPCHLQC